MSFAFLPLFTGDYLKKTRHLTPQKHGVYLLLLIHCWDTKGPLPFDEQECAGIANCRSADEIDSLRYILAKYFIRMEDGWYNERCQQEIEKSLAISNKRADAGKIGGTVRAKHLREKKNEASANQKLANAKHLSLTPTLTLTPTITKGKRQPPALPRGFAMFWDSYPHFPQRSSRAESLKRWQAMRLEPVADDVLRALQSCLAVPAWTKDSRSFVSAAEVWLRKKLWEQEPQTMNDALLESILADPRCQ